MTVRHEDVIKVYWFSFQYTGSHHVHAKINGERKTLCGFELPEQYDTTEIMNIDCSACLSKIDFTTEVNNGNEQEQDLAND